MNIALCMSGQLRNVTDSFSKSIQSNLFDCNREHTINTFVHAWYDNTTVGTVYYASNDDPLHSPIGPPVASSVVSDMYACYNPVKTLLQSQIIFDDHMYTDRRMPGAIPRNGMSRLYSMYQCNKLKSDHEQENGFEYDIVINTRFDVILHAPIIFITLHNLHIHHLGYTSHGFNPLFVYGHSGTMNEYCTLYHYIAEVYASGIRWCDEYLADTFLKMRNIPIEDDAISTSLNRVPL